MNLPQYQCFKKVGAVKITEIVPHGGGAVLKHEEATVPPVHVDSAYLTKHTPHVGGYYVEYADGYKSFSPAKAFAEGYKRII